MFEYDIPYVLATKYDKECKGELFKMHYHIKVVLHNPIDPMFDFPEIFFSRVIRTNDEIKFL